MFPALHLDRGYDSSKTRDLLKILGFHGEIATKGVPAPIQVGKRWPVERCHAWMKGFGKLRRLTDKCKIIAQFYLDLARPPFSRWTVGPLLPRVPLDCPAS